jgi:hypothetical protein
MATHETDMEYRLEDGLTASGGRVFLTGTQALVRMLLSQREADKAAGLNTAGFVTGYRGSPLGGVDMAMWRAQKHLDAHQISFLPAVNEDLGATMAMGTQQAGARQDRKVDGVFALWYGKGPGLDRAGDALHHGNAAGASAHGGVLLVVGDDHTAASSSIPHASETSLIGWSIPVINPASVEEYEYFGRWGWALSRYSGAWVAFKAVTETVESGRSFTVAPIPDFSAPASDRHQGAVPYSAREFLTPEIEFRMARRIEAVRAFSRLHSLDRLARPAPGAKLGIVSTGKAFLDTEDALEALAERYPKATLPALRHYKIGLSWPLDEQGLLAFSQGLDHILVVEEKAPIIEGQVKDILFNLQTRPTVSDQRAGPVAGAGRPGHGCNHGGGAALPRTVQHKRKTPRGRGTRGWPGVDAPPLFLFRLSAQHVHQGPRRQPGAGRRGLPLHGDLDGPRHRRIDANGRRGRGLDRPVTLYPHAACFPEHGGRHLLSLRLSGHQAGCRRRGQHHLQDSVQRCRGHDGRAACGRAHLGARHLPAALG